MNQARKDTTGVKLEVNERFVLFFYTCLYLESVIFFPILILITSVNNCTKIDIIPL